MVDEKVLGQIESNNKNAPEEETKPQFVIQTYKNRLRFIKEAHVYASRSDFVNAVTSYSNYLEALGLFYGISHDKLRPSHFTRGDEDVPEIMMVSLVYWELSKIYDRNPKLGLKLKVTLEQFVRFSVGYKFQFLNAENLRKYLRKGACVHVKYFEDAYKRIEVNSKKCFVATYSLGEGHSDLAVFYDFRDKIRPYLLGRIFIENYYRFSPSFVRYLENHPKLGSPLKRIFKDSLHFLAKILRKTIL